MFEVVFIPFFYFSQFPRKKCYFKFCNHQNSKRNLSIIHKRSNYSQPSICIIQTCLCESDLMTKHARTNHVVPIKENISGVLD